MHSSKLIAARLKESRLGKGWSQKELATKSGVSLRSIIFWEQGKGVPSGRNLQKLAEVFSVSSSWLLGEAVEGQMHDNFAFAAHVAEAVGGSEEEMSERFNRISTLLEELRQAREQQLENLVKITGLEAALDQALAPMTGDRGSYPPLKGGSIVAKDDASSSLNDIGRLLLRAGIHQVEQTHPGYFPASKSPGKKPIRGGSGPAPGAESKSGEK